MRFTLLAVAALALVNVSFAAPAPTTNTALNLRSAENPKGIQLARRSEEEAEEDEGNEDAPPAQNPKAKGTPKAPAPPAGGQEEKEESENKGPLGGLPATDGLPVKTVTDLAGGATKGGLPLDTVTGATSGLPLPLDAVTGLTGAGAGTGTIDGIVPNTDAVTDLANSVPVAKPATDVVASATEQGVPVKAIQGIPIVGGLA
ncbi:hypothetical protein [Parasitella parasitica]|uniref:Uncharacterized protein n=1 Tax=Parasitella parasitica TaxID=35722 RepID=A0A0B7NE21_9FUNG|nr:hypothetical protein [Parasitella parasitica]